MVFIDTAYFISCHSSTPSCTLSINNNNKSFQNTLKIKLSMKCFSSCLSVFDNYIFISIISQTIVSHFQALGKLVYVMQILIACNRLRFIIWSISNFFTFVVAGAFYLQFSVSIKSLEILC